MTVALGVAVQGAHEDEEEDEEEMVAVVVVEVLERYIAMTASLCPKPHLMLQQRMQAISRKRKSLLDENGCHCDRGGGGGRLPPLFSPALGCSKALPHHPIQWSSWSSWPIFNCAPLS